MFKSTSTSNPTCKYIIRRGERIGQVCGNSCTYNVYGKKTNYCSSHYAWTLINPNAPPPKKKRTTGPRTYVEMVMDAVQENQPKISLALIKRHISSVYRIDTSDKAVNGRINKAVATLVSGGRIKKIKGYYAVV